MAKHLNEPLIVIAEQRADRYDITSYAVNADEPSIDITYSCGRTNDDQTVTPLRTVTKHVDGGADLDAAMAAATTNIVGAVLAAAVQAQLLTAEQVTGIATAMAGNPTLAREAYYAGTRDALYGLL